MCRAGHGWRERTCGKLGTCTPSSVGGECSAATGHLMDGVEMKQVRFCPCGSLPVCLSPLHLSVHYHVSMHLSLIHSLQLHRLGYYAQAARMVFFSSEDEP